MEIPLDDVLPVFDEDGRHAAPSVDWSARVADASRDTELRLAVSSAIEELPAHYRAALVLRDVEGWSSAEVADVLSISVANAKTRVHRARLFVRKRLAESMSVAGFSPAFRQRRVTGETDDDDTRHRLRGVALPLGPRESGWRAGPRGSGAAGGRRVCPRRR